MLLGAMSSAILLYGMALLYGATGTTDLGEMAAAIDAWAAERQSAAAGGGRLHFRRVRLQDFGGAVPHVGAGHL